MFKLNLLISLIFSFLFISCLKEVSEPIEPSVLKKLKLIPSDPVNVIYLNIKNIKKTKYWKDFANDGLKIQTQNNKTIFDTLGIDFNKDIDEIIFASQWDDINTYIITLNKTVKPNEKNQKLKDFKYLIIDNKILFITNDERNFEKISFGDYENNFIKNPLFTRMMNSIQYKEHFWYLTRNTLLFLRLLKNEGSDNEKLEKLFHFIDFINFSIKLDKDMNLNSHWECVDKNRANLLSGILNGVISMAALTEPNDPFVEEISKANVFVESKAVNINLKIPKEKIDLIRQSVIANKLKRITEYE